jgi:hypothetical protein
MSSDQDSGGGRRTPEIPQRERCLVVRSHQLGVRIRPRLPFEGLPALGERAGRSH